MEVRLANVRHGNPEKGRQHFVYAELRCARSGMLLISADLDYIMLRVKQSRYILVGDPK